MIHLFAKQVPSSTAFNTAHTSYESYTPLQISNRNGIFPLGQLQLPLIRPALALVPSN